MKRYDKRAIEFSLKLTEIMFRSFLLIGLKKLW